MKDPEALINRLAFSNIIHAPALPFKRKSFCPDMAFVTDKGNVKIVAKGVDLVSGEETFYLDLDSFEADGYWLDKQGVPAWPPRETGSDRWSAIDYVETVKALGLTDLLKPKRRILLYRDPEGSSYGDLGALRSAKAISLSSPDFSQRLVISATAEFPCSIAVAINNSRAGELIFGMEEFTLPGTFLAITD